MFFYACIKNIQKFRAIRETSMDTAYQVFLEGRIKFILFLFVIFISLHFVFRANYHPTFCIILLTNSLVSPITLENRNSPVPPRNVMHFVTRTRYTPFFPSPPQRGLLYRCFLSFLANEFIETEINWLRKEGKVPPFLSNACRSFLRADYFLVRACINIF